MKIFDKNSWALMTSTSTDEGKYVGVAIGPDSEEGIVLVNNFTLCAGRVLPIGSEGGYRLVKVNAVAQDSAVNLADPTKNLTSVTRLQLMLLECFEELAIWCPRANKSYTSGIVQPANAGVYTRVLTVPFVGRRHALVDIQSSDGSLLAGYKVWGRRFMTSKPAAPASRIDEKLLASSTTQQAGAAFHIGGTNDEEPWHELAIELTQVNSALFTVDVDIDGEVGSS